MTDYLTTTIVIKIQDVKSAKKLDINKLTYTPCHGKSGNSGRHGSSEPTQA